MQQQIQLTPDQVPMALAQTRAELEAVNNVITLKTKAVQFLDRMEEKLANGDLSGSLSAYIEIQKIEYGLQIRGLNEKQAQVQGIIDQLESRVVRPGMILGR
jgi:hypothetical protein